MHDEIIIKAEKICNKSLENMAESLGRAVTNGSCIQEEIKSTLNSRNVCQYLVQNVLVSG
jgi:hypothetical protein